MQNSSERSSNPATATPRRIAVVTSDVPFVEGGHRVIARALAEELGRAGYLAEVIRTPQNPFGRQFAAYLANWLTDVVDTGDGAPVDQVISLRYPAYAVRHPRHVCWLNHRMREYYDLWPRLVRQISWKGKFKESVRRMLIRQADRYLLTRNVARVYAQSRTVQSRLEQWGGIPSEVLYPPPPARPYRTEAYEGYIFTASRLDPLKRLDLLLKALKHVESSGLRAVIAGTGGQEGPLRRLAGELRVSERIDFLGRVDEATLLRHYARCRAVFFAPYMEDYGFVTLEAFRSKKPVVTCSDSGGPTELVVHDHSGFVVRPETRYVASCLERLAQSETRAVQMGESGYEAAAGVTWEKAIGKLLLQ